MIDDSIEVFPFNAVEIIVPRLQTIDPDVVIVRRALRDSDGTQTIGIFPITWEPDETSLEIGGREPTIQRYPIAIQSCIKETDEEKGIRVHGVFAKRIRSLLYRDQPLNIGLAALSVSMDGGTERISRRRVRNQRFLSGEIGGVFNYLAVTEYVIETETV